MQLPSPETYSDWSDEIAEDALGEMNGAISIYAPGKTGVYDPTTNAFIGGTDDTLVIGPDRAAIVQEIRRPLTAVTAGTKDVTMDVVFQIELVPSDPIITKGMIVRVTDGGKNAQLAQFTYSVLNVLNASHAATRVIQAVTETAVAGGS